MKIFRDSNGVIVNIGDWDYKLKEDYETGTMVKTNPLPDNYVEDDAEVAVDANGNFYVIENTQEGE